MSHKTEAQESKKTSQFVNTARKAALLLFIKSYNSLLYLFPAKKPTVFSKNPLIRDIQKRALVPTDISLHLMDIFATALEAKPKTIVELGTRGGESTFVLERVASITGAKMLCVDLADCKDACAAETLFVQGDDIEFGKNFPQWAVQNNFPSKIDVLFIDTSHEYHHTKAEIATYFPHLSDTATVMFHDTNMQYVFTRTGGTLGYGYCEDILRGVIQPIEEYLGTPLDGEHDFVEYINGWLVKHHAISSGFTIMKKLPY